MKADYDDRGQVALWQPRSDNPRAPKFKGSFIAHRDIREGEKIDLAVWENDSDNPNAPVLKGKGSDPYTKEDASQAKQEKSEHPEGFSSFDEIPF